MPTSQMAASARPNWYLLQQMERSFGEYFGSASSIASNETYVTQDKRYIVHRDALGAFSVSRNACAHAGAQLLEKPGVQDHKSIRCPVHQWLYEPSGNLIAAPFFEKCERMRLHRPDFGMWNGYVLGYNQREIDDMLASFGEVLEVPKSAFNPSEFVFMEEVEYGLPYPPELMMINYMDGYHVPLCHQKTFDAVADASTYQWELSPLHPSNRAGYSIQEVRARKNVSQRMDAVLRNNHDLTDKDLGWARFHLWIDEVFPSYGVQYPIDKDIFALWAAFYGKGHVMPELYEGGLFLAVSYLVNVDAKNPYTGNANFVEYYVHKNVPEYLREKAYRLFKTAYQQSAREDDEICMRLWAAHQQGELDFDRIYHQDLEKGDVHWREWLKFHSVTL
jgi:nitrite reductase/ring-hydroxylating ferredoxin subunit